jgi:hypothetical protein
MNFLKEILNSLRKKIDSFRCVMKCGPVKETKTLDILDETVGM